MKLKNCCISEPFHRPPTLNFCTDYDSEHEELAITLSNELKGAKRAGDEEGDADSGENEVKVPFLNRSGRCI